MALQVLYLVLQHGQHRFPPLRRKGRLGHGQGLRKIRQLRRFLRRGDHVDLAAAPSRRPPDLGMLLLADQQHRRSVPAALCNDLVHPVHEGAGQVENLASLFLQLFQHVRAYAVAADQHAFPPGFLRSLDQCNSFFRQVLDHGGIMDQLSQRAGWNSVPGSLFRCLHCTTYAHAESGVSRDLNGHFLILAQKSSRSFLFYQFYKNPATLSSCFFSDFFPQ